MLQAAQPIGFLAISDVGRARKFYTRGLGLTLLMATDDGLVLDVNGMPLRLSLVPDFSAQSFTVFGWQVEEIETCVEKLLQNGVVFEHFDGLDQDENGIWTSPARDKVAWFKDPDNNLLSLTQAAG